MKGGKVGKMNRKEVGEVRSNVREGANKRKVGKLIGNEENGRREVRRNEGMGIRVVRGNSGKGSRDVRRNEGRGSREIK